MAIELAFDTKDALISETKGLKMLLIILKCKNFVFRGFELGRILHGKWPYREDERQYNVCNSACNTMIVCA
jgi:hypothetical protein